MNAIYIQGKDFHAQTSADLISRAMRHLLPHQERGAEQARLSPVRVEPDLGKLRPVVQLQPARDGEPGRAGQASRLVEKSRCTPACTGHTCGPTMSEQVAFARGRAA